ncbi:hypothetical protein ABZV65_30840 [Streptomyces bauhiniae]|uniref:hypothetical protein n=1 Tax=Streptomyces bauhiniae TaxID=2340725 RepID=UPI0033B9BA2E
MTKRFDPELVDAMWRAIDLTRAYLLGDSRRIALYLADLETSRLPHVLAWLLLEHDQHLDRLGGPTMNVQLIDTVAAAAPLEVEFEVTAAVRRVAAKEVRLTQALEDLERPLNQVHAITIYTAAMMAEGYGRDAAVQQLDHDAAGYELIGYPRPYPIP